MIESLLIFPLYRGGTKEQRLGKWLKSQTANKWWILETHSSSQIPKPVKAMFVSKLVYSTTSQVTKDITLWMRPYTTFKESVFLGQLSQVDKCVDQEKLGYATITKMTQKSQWLNTTKVCFLSNFVEVCQEPIGQIYSRIPKQTTGGYRETHLILGKQWLWLPLGISLSL